MQLTPPPPPFIGFGAPLAAGNVPFTGLTSVGKKIWPPLNQLVEPGSGARTEPLPAPDVLPEREPLSEEAFAELYRRIVPHLRRRARANQRIAGAHVG